MPFFMVTNGNTHPHTFDYLTDESSRVDPTLPRGMRMIENDEDVKGELKEFYVIETMTKEVISLFPDDPVQKAIDLMSAKRIHHIPIHDQDEGLVGLVSDRDLLKLNGEALFSLVKIKDIMSTIVVAVGEETPLSAVAKVLVKEHISALPVLNTIEEISGIISKVDILEKVIEHKLLQ
jgi:CBS domain-containing protein